MTECIIFQFCRFFVSKFCSYREHINMNKICRITYSPLISISHVVGRGKVHPPHNGGGVSRVQQLVCDRMMHSSRCTKVFSSSEDDESDGAKYSTSEDDVVGFGRVIRDPRMSKRDILKESLPGGSSSTSDY